MDTRPPMMESSSPTNMGTKVSVLQPISVFFDEPLDPASVTAATVKLGYDQSQPPLVFPAVQLEKMHGPVPAGLTPVKGTVSYDPGPRKVSFVPAVPLPYGYAFTLSLDVKDTAGLPFTGAVKFATYVNANTRQYSFSSTNGVPTSWIGQPTDMNGRLAKRIGGGAPGPDTVWFTADDPKNQHQDFNFAPDGRIIDERYYDIGPDNQYDTSDDPVIVCAKYVYDAQGVLADRTYSGVIGPDNMWCTGDDVPAVHAIYSYMGSKLTGWVLNNSPGPDNVWRNSDDRCSRYFEYSYDAQGNKTREVVRLCGSDALPRTADDGYSQYFDYEYDANGNLTKSTHKNGAGPDTVWFTPDDSVLRVERFERNADGLVANLITTTGSGVDGLWGTADDTPGNRTATSYDAKKLAEEITTYNGFGADSMWGTNDDVTNSYSKLTYDELGNRTDQKQYTAGPDGMWRTPDDRVSSDFDFDLNK